MIPGLITLHPSLPWRVLPPGIHVATIQQIEAAFATDRRRGVLLDGFIRGTVELAAAGCTKVYLNGSFATDKIDPGDFDACWDETGVVGAKLDPVFFDLAPPRTAQKAKYGGEFFPASFSADGYVNFLSFFQNEKHTNLPKGIIELRLPF